MSRTPPSAGPRSEEPVDAAGRQRIDRWLWHARFFRSRSLAAAFVADGRVRVTRGGITARIEKPATDIGPGDVLSLPLRRGVTAVRVRACAPRRGPAAEARALYEPADGAPGEVVTREGDATARRLAPDGKPAR